MTHTPFADGSRSVFATHEYGPLDQCNRMSPPPGWCSSVFPPKFLWFVSSSQGSHFDRWSPPLTRSSAFECGCHLTTPGPTTINSFHCSAACGGGALPGTATQIHP